MVLGNETFISLKCFPSFLERDDQALSPVLFLLMKL